MLSMIHSVDREGIESLALKIIEVQKLGGKIFLFGNGGSASTAEHASVDLSKGISEFTGKKFSAVCLNSNVSQNSAWSNDNNYELTFAKMLNLELTPPDIVMGISASGNSPNIVNGLKLALSLGNFTCSLTGFDGGEAKSNSELNINVDSSDMQIIENIHLVIVHALFKHIVDIGG